MLQVSTEPSTVVAYRWAFNHGVGMLVSLFLNSHVEFFSKDIRQSRVLADVLNDVALSVEMALPYVPVAWVAPLMLVATTMKCMCGFISGATRAAITAHFARDGNEADVAVKEGNQENLVTAAGLVMGGLFVRSVGSERSVIGAFAVLTYLHVVWNLAAVRQLRLRTLSFQRYHIAVALYFNNIRPTRSLVNKCEMFFYRRPKGAGGNGKVEDFWEGMEKNSDSDYYVSRDRLFFKRGARRSEGLFHFHMLRRDSGFFKQVDKHAKKIIDERSLEYLVEVDLGIAQWQEMLLIEFRTANEMHGIYCDFSREMDREGWDHRGDMGEETEGYLERSPPKDPTVKSKKGRSRSQGVKKDKKVRRRTRVQISDEPPF